jgi:DNA-binding transcriptional regulator YhcF (GntR family)
MKESRIFDFTLNHKSKVSKAKQIVNAVIRDIERGLLEPNFHLPSVNELERRYSISRDTIDRAYSELKSLGYVASVTGKGYYVIGKKEVRLKVLLILDELSSFKKVVYYEFIKTLGDKAKVDLQVHHYDFRLLKEIVAENLGKYHYYIIMPHFIQSEDRANFLKIFETISSEEMIFLDRDVPELGHKCIGVFQDFREDVYNALIELGPALDKYKNIRLVFSTPNNHPLEIIEGIKKFSKTEGKIFSIIQALENERLKKGSLYIVITEDELGKLIRSQRSSNLKLGEDIGIISYNESILKELLDITVIGTDFEEMGRAVAKLLLNKEHKQIKNHFSIIKRGSI